METKTIPLTTITPYWRNPRISDKAVSAVVQSIQDYGFINPIILDKDLVIIAGHTRYRALQQLGRTEASCIITDLTPDQAKAYRIADNKTSEITAWDMPMLVAELRELHDLPAMSIYFPEMNIVSLIEQTTTPMLPSSEFSSAFSPTVTQEMINKKAAVAAQQFQSAPQKVLLDVHCPHCQQSFSFDPEYFMQKA